MDISLVDGRLLCILQGNLDTRASEELGRRVEAGLEEARCVEFEMSGVTYVCSSFLRVCLATAQALGATNLRLVALPPRIRRVFKTAGLDRVLELE
jgi:anti-anti-sigma factor